MDDMDEKISQFASVTGVDLKKAQFYVESAGGDVQEAVTTYFESEGPQGEGAKPGNEPDSSVIAAPSGPRTLSGAPAPPMPEGWGSTAQSGDAGRAGGASAKSKASASGGGRMTSLADLGGGDDSDDDDGDHSHGDDDDPVNFFAGGERSGLSVQNPNHGRRAANVAPGVVRDILQRAREMAERRAQGGAEANDEDEDWGEGGPTGAARAAAKPAASSFAGQGRTLADAGGSDNDTTAEAHGDSGSRGEAGGIPGGFQLAGEGSGSTGASNEIVNRRIIFWQDGFALEDGPLCRYDDPQHAQTLAMINQGAAPVSFLNVRFGQRVNLTVEQRHEKYKAPLAPPVKPFGGHGTRLGSPAPGLAAASSSSAPSAAITKADSPPQAAVVPTSFKVDDDQPTTQLQIRLADGQRVMGRFNHSHTVGDVRNLINAAHPGMASRAFVLQASFPPKPFDDETQTLKDAGLINAVVIQKWT